MDLRCTAVQRAGGAIDCPPSVGVHVLGSVGAAISSGVSAALREASRVTKDALVDDRN